MTIKVASGNGLDLTINIVAANFHECYFHGLLKRTGSDEWH